MDATTFRTTLPAFASEVAYPDATVNLWLAAAKLMVNADRWMEMTDTGIALVTAHYLVLESRSQAAASRGGTAGEMNGPTSSKSVDKVSVSYDTSAATIEGAGAWNLTSYGVRYLTLARMFGAGGIQL